MLHPAKTRRTRWIRSAAAAAPLLAALAAPAGPAAARTIVAMDFNLEIVFGQDQQEVQDTVFIELFDEARPLTTSNFLGFVTAGRFDGSLLHRLATDFVLQGGGFLPQVEQQTIGGQTQSVIQPVGIDLDGDPATPNPTVPNEFDGDPAFSNVRGTLAMAKLGGDPDSATSQFFFNIADNSANLDNQNGGFTTFARVIGNGMRLIDAYNELLDPLNLNPDNNGDGFRDPGPFDTVPVALAQGRLLTLDSVSVVTLTPGDTDLDGQVTQDDADLLQLVLDAGTDEPQFDVDANGVVEQRDLDLLAARLALPADLNGDGFVGAGDLDILLGKWNADVTPGLWVQGDLTGDGFVGAGDLDVLLGLWNQSAGSGVAAAPEPATLTAVALGAGLLGRRRRR